MKLTQNKRAAGLLAALVFLTLIAPEPYIVKISFLGDVMLGRGIALAASRSTNWQPFTALQPILQSADFTAANLESPLTTAPVETSGYALCAPPGQVEALKSAGFSLLTLANNHNLDCGVGGLNQTRSTLQSSGLQTAGPELSPVFIDNHSRRFAFFALDDVSSAIDLPVVLHTVNSAANQADWVIISIHWGSEYQPAPSIRQRKLAAALIDAGVDVIIGHHPHVIQPMEMITRNNTDQTGLVFYSLGNSLFDQNSLPDTRTGEIVNLFFKAGQSASYSVQRFEFDPRMGIIRSVLP